MEKKNQVKIWIVIFPLEPYFKMWWEKIYMLIVGNLDNTENTQKENNNYSKAHQPGKATIYILA